MTVASGMDLVLCAIDAASGRARFGPRLSYALPVAELADLEAAGRVAVRADGLALLDTTPTGEPHADTALSALDEKWPPPAAPLTVLWWARWRGPRRIDSYLSGEDLNSSQDQCATRWVINFRDWPLDRKGAPPGHDGPVASVEAVLAAWSV